MTKSLGACDVIIGRDILEFPQMDIKFSDVTVAWDHKSIPFKDQDSDLTDFFVEEPDVAEDANERLGKILDAECEKADLNKICNDQPELSESEQEHLLQLLTKCESLFDGTLGTWNGTKADPELNEGAIPHHARAFLKMRWQRMT